MVIGPALVAALTAASPAAEERALDAPAEVVLCLLGRDQDATGMRMVTRRWKRSFVVVLLTRDEQDGALGLFRAGDAPWEERFVATTGRLTVPGDEAIGELDLAPYHVSSNETAIGLRFHRQRGYAGGSGEATVVRLYLRQAQRLVPILSTAVEFNCLLAGAWNDDGTRDHQEVTGASAIVVSRKTTNGHFDLLQDGQVFRWNGTRYVANRDLWSGCEVTEASE